MDINKIYNKIIASSRWKRESKTFRATNQICSMCGAHATYKQLLVHHVKPIKEGKDVEECRRLAHDPHNWIVLCHQCHYEVHRKLNNKNKES